MHDILADLAKKRPIFHSEADFQHALAWEMHQRQFEIRLEYRSRSLPEKAYVDIWVSRDQTVTAVELKYKTRALRVTVADEPFDLVNQGAQDIARCDFLKDVARLERLVAQGEVAVGYAIFLTNDPICWNPSARNDTVDALFRLHEGRQVTGKMSWDPKAADGTTKGRKEPIVLTGTYTVTWRDYSEPVAEKYGKFRYLLLRVVGPHRPDDARIAEP